MSRDDLLKHTRLWVIGQCVVWNAHALHFADVHGVQFAMFQDRTHNIVWRYLHGRQVLDGTCSDFECEVALQAKKVFGPHLQQ